MQVQKDLSEDISEKLRSRLTGEQMEKVAKNYTDNADAYQLYMKGRYHWNKRTEEGIKKGIEYFQQAIEKDPSYALAYSGLADSYGVDTSPFPIEERRIKAKAAAKKALEIDDSLAEAHASLSTALQMERDWIGTDQQLKRALELNPNYATARQWYAENLLILGKVDQALVEIKKAQELDPFSIIINSTLAWVNYHARNYDFAIEQYKKTLEMDPRFDPSFDGLKDCYVAKKMYTKLIDLVEERIREEGNNPAQLANISAIRKAYQKGGETEFWKKVLEVSKKEWENGNGSMEDIAVIYAKLGEKDKSFEWLERGYQEHRPWLNSMKTNPKWDNLRSDPRFNDLLRRMNLL
jgi:tetratricopeptide (TPR) repeat protein